MTTVGDHYGRGGLGETLLAALADAGKDTEALRPAEEAPIDEFHIRGREATLELAELAAIAPEHHVLDVGSGIGGPSRHLAEAFGCRVTGLDLTAEYCEVAAMLAARTGLEARVDYRHGDATPPALDWFRAIAAKAKAPAPLGLHLLMGRKWGTMVANQVQNLEQDRIRLLQAVLERPA